MDFFFLQINLKSTPSFSNFIIMLKHNLKRKKNQCDNVKEYENAQVKIFCEFNGMVWFSCPPTS